MKSFKKILANITIFIFIIGMILFTIGVGYSFAASNAAENGNNQLYISNLVATSQNNLNAGAILMWYSIFIYGSVWMFYEEIFPAK